MTRNLISTQFNENLRTLPRNPHRDRTSNIQHRTATKTKKIQLEENLVDFSSGQKDASGAETPTIDQQVALPKIPNAGTAVGTAIMQECVCSNACKRFTRL